MLRVPLAPQVWTANDTFKSTPLEGGIFLRALVIDAAFSIAWDGAKTAFQDAFARSLRYDLFLADSNPIASFRGDVWKNFHESISQVADSYTEADMSAAATTIARHRLVIPFADPNLPKPDDTAYDMALAKSPRLDVNWSGLGAMTATAAGASALVSATINVTMLGVQRPAGLTAVQRNMIRRYKQYGLLGTADIPAGTNDGRYLKMDVGGTVRRVFIQTRESTSATKPRVDGLLSRCGWYINGNKYGMAPWEQLQQYQRGEKHVIPATGTLLQDFDVSGDIDPQELLSLVGVDGTAGIEVATPAALANGLEVAYLDESILFPPAGA